MPVAAFPCMICGNHTQSRTQVYDVYYHMCPTCAADSYSWTSDGMSVRGPRTLAMLEMPNGDYPEEVSSNRNVFESFSGGFTCCNCSTYFYTGGVTMHDSDEHWCIACARDNAYFSHENQRWYEDEESRDEADNNCINQEDGSSYKFFEGEETDRFLARPMVGIEFEHAPVRYGYDAVSESALYLKIQEALGPMKHAINRYDDGSIAHYDGYCANELVTMPSSGDKLEKLITAFYQPFADGLFQPGPEHPSCGFHVHVASRFLFALKRRTNFEPKVKRAVVEIAKIMTTLVKEFVSSSRRSNHFCNRALGMRDKNASISGGSQMADIYGITSYPAIAIRSIGTFEFRLWPSTNSINYMKARVELSQKLVVYHDKCIMDKNDVPIVDNDAIDRLKAITALCTGGRRTEVPAALGSLLGLSDKCVKSLTDMMQRFSPFSGKKTAFKFTEIQVACMTDEDSTMNDDISVPSTSTIIHEAYDTTMRDCTAEHASRDHGLYFSFGRSFKCYPATGDPENVKVIAALAKGEI